MAMTKSVNPIIASAVVRMAARLRTPVSADLGWLSVCQRT